MLVGVGGPIYFSDGVSRRVGENLHFVVALKEVGRLSVAEGGVTCTTNLCSTAMSEVFPLLAAFV